MNHEAKSRSGGEALVDGLAAHGIDTVYGIPGAQIYGLFDAFATSAQPIRVVSARHEQACAYMAFGHAQATGAPSVFAVVPGPGILNAGAALLTALGCNAPVLALTGQVPTAFLDKGRGHLHEMPDQLATMRGFVKHAARVEHAGLAGQAVARAFQEMTSGRPGPAAIEMPWDVFTRRAPASPCPPLAQLPPPPVDPDAIKEAARMIDGAKRPMIFVGSGAIGARDAVKELAEKIGAPVVAFRSGRGIVSNADELGLTLAEAYKLWPETDLMIGIGTRLELPAWRWPFRPDGLKSIRIDIDPAEMRRFEPDCAIIADADPATRALADKVAGRRNQDRDAIRDARARTGKEIKAIQPQVDYLEVIRQVLPANGIVTDEMSQVGFASWYGFPVYEPRTFLSAGYQGTLGSGFPTALGAKVAFPDRPVVAITGDGGFMFAVQELATAVQHGIGVVTLVFNNASYGNVRRDQVQAFDGRVVGADLVNPDFVRLAESFGIAGRRVESPAALKPVLEAAIAADEPALIEIAVERGSESSPWPFIHPPRPEGV